MSNKFNKQPVRYTELAPRLFVWLVVGQTVQEPAGPGLCLQWKAGEFTQHIPSITIEKRKTTDRELIHCTPQRKAQSEC